MTEPTADDTDRREEVKRLVVEHVRRDAEAPLPDPIFVIAEGDLVTTCFYQPQPSPQEPSTRYTFFRYDTFRVVGGEVVEHWSGRNRASSSTVPPLEATRAEQPAPVGGPASPEQLAANKRLVVDFFRVVLEGHDPEAAKDYVTEDYRQHAAHIQQGRAGLEAFVRAISPDGPVPVRDELPSPTAVLVAEGDLVVIAGNLRQPDPQAPGDFYDYFVYDGFRVQDGLLAEHWSGVDVAALPRH